MPELITLNSIDQKCDLGQILNQEDPMQELYNIYEEVNRKAERDESVALEARTLFSQLEAGNANLKRQWSDIRNSTGNTLKEVYA